MAKTLGSLALSICVLGIIPAPAQNSTAALPEQDHQQAARIATLQSQLTELRKIYSENHPNIRKLEGQIQMLRDEPDAQNPQPTTDRNSATALSVQRDERAIQIATAESQLIELRKVYTENHPNIHRLEIQLRTLREQSDAQAK